MQLKNTVAGIKFYLEPLVEWLKSRLSVSLRSRLDYSPSQDLIKAQNNSSTMRPTNRPNYQVESRSRLIFWWRLRQSKTYSGDEVLQRFNRRRTLQRLWFVTARVGVCSLLIFSLVVYIFYPKFPQQLLSLTRSAFASSMASYGIKIEKIEILGTVQLTKAEVLAASGLAPGQPLMGFDGSTIRRTLLALPWVQEAVVERRPPAIVSIKITERTPVALWRESTARNSGESYVYIDSFGRPLVYEGAMPGQRILHEKLIRFVGVGANQMADSLHLMLKVEPVMAGRVTQAEWVGGRRWNLIIDNRLLVKLPELKAANSWSKLAELEAKYKICDRQIAVIDLRQLDRMIVTRGNSWLETTATQAIEFRHSENMGRLG